MSGKVDLPFERSRAADGQALLWLRRGYAESLLRAGIERPACWLRTRARRSATGRGGAGRAGRGPVAVLPLPGRPGEHAVVKRHRRGGLAGRLLPDLFLGPGRFVRELRAAEQALGRGIPVPRPLALVRRGRWGLYRLYSASLEVPSAESLLDLARRPLPLDQRRELVRRAGRAVREMQDRGLFHPDLNLGNLIVSGRGEGAGVHVVDLAGSRLLRRLSVRQRRKALRRLRRSWEKHLFLQRSRGGSEVARFLLAYCAGDGALREALRRRGLLDRLALTIHRLGWRMARPAD